VNHYQRLKVSPDAPAEVIRAAYRALAAKLHPDRQGAATGPDDQAHHEMAALNAAYEVLIDPKLREDYDAELSPQRLAVVDVSLDAAQPGHQRVDPDWLTTRPAAQRAWWPPDRRLIIGGGMALVFLAGGVTWLVDFLLTQNQMDMALSAQYAAPSADQSGAGTGAPRVVPAAVPMAPSPGPTTTRQADDRALTRADEALAGPSGHKPTVAELSRMSDEELLKVLPTLDTESPPDADGAAGGRRAQTLAKARQHMLDGKPLSLRTETHLVDPLATEAGKAP
jgi:hypothetical protein